MTEQTSQPSSASSRPSGRPPLRRTHDHRIVAGVCGGLARHVDADPIIFRVLFVVSAFFGGFGVLAYALAWLLIRSDDEEDSELQQLMSGRGVVGALAIAGLVLLGFGILVSMIRAGFWAASPLLLAAAVILLVIRGTDRGRVQSMAATPPTPPMATAPNDAVPTDAPQPWWQRPTPPLSDDVPVDLATLRTSDTPPTRDLRLADDSRRQGPPVAAIGFAGTLAVLGVLATLEALGAFHLSVQDYLAITVLTLGVAITASAWFGRGFGLVPLGVIAVLPLLAAGAMKVPLTGDSGNPVWRPVSAAAVPSNYQMSFGDGQLDLTAVNPAGGLVPVHATMAGGRLRVTVPNDVTIKVVSHVGAGRITTPDGTTSGVDRTRDETVPAVGKSVGTIELDLRVGVGALEVQRVS